MKTELSIKAAIYLRAAELVEQGHCKGLLWERNEKGEKIAYCYRGALIKAECEATKVSEVFARLAWNAETEKFVRWNNAPDTTAAMVAQKLREQAFS